MLIYNHKKEFLGIDRHDLNALGFETLAKLKEESEDFADLFVKEPGFVHNFKHVHWIDFVDCDDSNEGSKVIIKTSSQSFKCNLEVKTLYLSENPQERAFVVYLLNLRKLIEGENGHVSEVMVQKSTHEVKKETPIVAPIITEDVQEEIFQEEVFTEPLPEQEVKEQLDLPKKIEIEEPVKVEVESIPITIDAPIHVEIEEETEADEEFEEIEEIEEVEEYETDSEAEDKYVYNPNVASSELGLPVDLIEEFIQDFIDQAKEFKAGLYNAFETGDTANVKSLSHKLKGVAANLRIEDALEALTIINTSSNPSDVKSNLDSFYIIIAKLAGETVSVPKKVVKSKVVKKRVPKKSSPKKPSLNVKTESQEDDLVVTFKEDDVDSTAKENTPQQVKKEEPNIDDFIITFKDEEDDSAPQKEEAKPELQHEENEFVISFKEDENSDNETISIASNDEEDDYTLEPVKEEKIELGDNIEIPDTLLAQSEDAAVIYSKKDAAKEIGLDAEGFNELFEDYINEAKNFSKEIQTAAQENDIIQWKSTAAKLKGMSDNMRVYDFDVPLEALSQTDDTESAKKISQKIEMLISKISQIES